MQPHSIVYGVVYGCAYEEILFAGSFQKAYTKLKHISQGSANPYICVFVKLKTPEGYEFKRSDCLYRYHTYLAARESRKSLCVSAGSI